MYVNPCRQLGGYPEEAYAAGGYVSEGFPAQCLEYTPNVGFRWLCGEPVPEGAQHLLEGSLYEEPVTEEVAPEEIYCPSCGFWEGRPGAPDPGDITDRGGAPSPDVLVTLEEEPGFGILPWIAGILVAVALS
jgi:hypothetical protein